MRQPSADETTIIELQRQLEFWRERLQTASNSCRSGALRERASSEIQSLERTIEDLSTRTRSTERRGAV